MVFFTRLHAAMLRRATLQCSFCDAFHVPHQQLATRSKGSIYTTVFAAASWQCSAWVGHAGLLNWPCRLPSGFSLQDVHISAIGHVRSLSIL